MPLTQRCRRLTARRALAALLPVAALAACDRDPIHPDDGGAATASPTAAPQSTTLSTLLPMLGVLDSLPEALRVGAGVAHGVRALDASLAAVGSASPSYYIVLQNRTTGDHALWGMSGTTRTGADVLLPRDDPKWEMAGTGDFTGDGKADILFQHTVTGARGIWQMNGTAVAGWTSFPSEVPAWQMAAVADFSGDQKPDVVFQNTSTGARGMWLMNGTAWAGWASLPSEITQWQMAAAADFTGDGKPDVLFQNTSTGARGVWVMNNTAWAGWVGFISESPEWDMAAAYDVNGDGSADIFFQNRTTGLRGWWLMNGSQMIGWVTLGTLDPAWDIVGVLPTQAAPVGPAAPSSLTASLTLGVSGFSARVDWTDASGDETEFRLERRIAGGSWSQFGVYGANVTGMTWTGAAEGTTYDWRARACNASGCSAYSPVATVVAPVIPTLLSNTPVTGINVSVNDALWYKLQVPAGQSELTALFKGGTGGVQLSLGRTVSSASSCSSLHFSSASFAAVTRCGVGSPAEGLWYVRLYNGATTAFTGGTLSVAYGTSSTVPAAPTGLSLTGYTPNAVDVWWDDNSTSETSFELQRRVAGGAWDAPTVLPANTAYAGLTGLDPVTTYEVRIRACNAAGCSDYVGPASITTLAMPPLLQSGVGVPNVSGGVGSSTWLAFSVPAGATNVSVTTSGGSGDVDLFLRTGIGTNVGTYCASANTGNAEACAFSSVGSARIFFVELVGYTPYSGVTVTASYTAPPAPVATPLGIGTPAFSDVTSSQATFTWTDRATDETEYQIWRSVSGGQVSLVATLPANTTSYVATGLSPNTTYAYFASACNASGGCSSLVGVQVTTPLSNGTYARPAAPLPLR